MLIVLHGENSFLTRRKLAEIVAQYKAKHHSGLSLFAFDEDADIRDVKTAYETHAMFTEKKLIVCKTMLRDAATRVALCALLKDKGAKEDKDTVMVLSEDILLSTEKNKDTAWLLAKPAMVQESKALTGERLVAWIREEAERSDARIADDAVRELIMRCGSDLWRLEQEIAKCAARASSITKETVVVLVTAAASAAQHIFPGVDALAEKNFAAASRHFSAAQAQGEDWAKIFGAVAFQFRSMLKARDLLDRGVPSAQAQKLSGMQPFVFHKASRAAHKYKMPDLRSAFSLLAELDAALKTGKLSFPEALDRLMLQLSRVG